jgi:hypothetical protein
MNRKQRMCISFTKQTLVLNFNVIAFSEIRYYTISV